MDYDFSDYVLILTHIALFFAIGVYLLAQHKRPLLIASLFCFAQSIGIALIAWLI